MFQMHFEICHYLSDILIYMGILYYIWQLYHRGYLAMPEDIFGYSNCRKTLISWSALDKNLKAGYLFATVAFLVDEKWL